MGTEVTEATGMVLTDCGSGRSGYMIIFYKQLLAVSVSYEKSTNPVLAADQSGDVRWEMEMGCTYITGWDSHSHYCLNCVGIVSASMSVCAGVVGNCEN